jgi:hypothetical protein
MLPVAMVSFRTSFQIGAGKLEKGGLLIFRSD